MSRLLRASACALVLLAGTATLDAYGDTYRVTVNRVGSNHYRDSRSGRIIETQLCLELALGDEAVLHWTGSRYDGWIVFSNGQRCDVVGVY